MKMRRSGEDPANTYMDNLRALLNESGVFCSAPIKAHQETTANQSSSESSHYFRLNIGPTSFSAPIITFNRAFIKLGWGWIVLPNTMVSSRELL